MKAVQFRAQRVPARLQAGEPVPAVGLRRGRAYRAGLDVAQHHRDAGQHAALRVSDGAGDSAAGVLRGRWCHADEGERDEQQCAHSGHGATERNDAPHHSSWLLESDLSLGYHVYIIGIVPINLRRRNRRCVTARENRLHEIQDELAASCTRTRVRCRCYCSRIDNFLHRIILPDLFPIVYANGACRKLRKRRLEHYGTVFVR